MEFHFFFYGNLLKMSESMATAEQHLVTSYIKMLLLRKPNGLLHLIIYLRAFKQETARLAESIWHIKFM